MSEAELEALEAEMAAILSAEDDSIEAPEPATWENLEEEMGRVMRG